MERERLGNGCYRVFLSDEELREWGLSFERLDGRSPCARALLSAILVAVSEGESLFDDGVVAEVFPVEGGCFLLFSQERERQSIIGKTGVPLCAAFETADDLFSFSSAAASLLPMASDLYTTENRLWLVLYPVGEREEQTATLLSEWECSVRHGAVFAAYLEEHGRCTYRGDALERLNEAR